MNLVAAQLAATALVAGHTVQCNEERLRIRYFQPSIEFANRLQ